MAGCFWQPWPLPYLRCVWDGRLLKIYRQRPHREERKRGNLRNSDSWGGILGWTHKQNLGANLGIFPRYLDVAILNCSSFARTMTIQSRSSSTQISNTKYTFGIEQKPCSICICMAPLHTSHTDPSLFFGEYKCSHSTLCTTLVYFLKRLFLDPGEPGLRGSKSGFIVSFFWISVGYQNGKCVSWGGPFLWKAFSGESLCWGRPFLGKAYSGEGL